MPVGRYPNAAMTLDWAPDEPPAGTTAEPLALPTPDRSGTTGLLYRPSRPTNAVVCLCHPRVDFTRHYLIPPLLRAGFNVWAQRTRYVNNDASMLHELLLLDLAVAHARLAALGLDEQYLVGNSGGASLAGFYIEQATKPAAERLRDAPCGQAVDLSLEMPVPRGLVLLAPHPGQGQLLMHCIDPAVVDEADPGATDPKLDLFNPTNGFSEPPASSSYTDQFIARYRAAQRERVARLDEQMRARLAERAEMRRRGKAGDLGARRRALVAGYVTVHRTDADPRTVDLSLDPSDRDYGSIFGRRPGITNYGGIGFGRLTTPAAWLSTWSGLSSRAALARTAPHIAVPTLVVVYTADNSVFPADVAAIEASLASPTVDRADVVADHYGYPRGKLERSPAAGQLICEWLHARRA